MEKTKKCSKCGRVLPVSSFYRNRTTKDGYQTYCKDCMKVATNAPKNVDTAEETLDILIKRIRRNPEFSLKKYFTPRELINALYDYGYRGEITLLVEQKVRLSHE